MFQRNTDSKGKMMISFRHVLAVTVAMLLVFLAAPAAQAADIEISDFETTFSSAQAGDSADYQLRFRVAPSDPSNPSGPVTGIIMDQVVDLPKGFIGDPTRFSACPMSRITFFAIERCPVDSVVGTANLLLFNGAAGSVLGAPYRVRVYRVEAYPGEAAAFAFAPLVSYTVRLSATVDPSNGYRVRMTSRNQQAGAALVDADVTMWGVPAEHQGPGSFNEGGYPQSFGGPLPATVRRHRFTGVPARCDGPSETLMTVASWQHRVFIDPVEASAPTPVGCENLVFSPALEMSPSVKATAVPSGYRAVLQLGQNSESATPRTPNLKDAVVRLPEGVAISPSAGNGLVACSDQQLAIDSAAQEQCPAASKIGDVLIESPVLDDPVPGEIFTGSQLSEDPASGEMFRIFLVATASGVKIKLRGQIAVDPVTGQITARFLDNPDLPLERMTLNFKAGERAPLTTPPVCGDHNSASSFTSWAGQSVSLNSPMSIDQGCAPKGFSPSMRAGSTNPVAGGSSEFVLAGSKTDGDLEVKTLRNIQLPAGLLGHVGSVDLCDEAQAAAGNCPAASRVGHVQVAAGLGSEPVWVPQPGNQPSSVSLTGPYKGAPYGLSIVVPAQAGPFDLGKVVVRSALHVNERTAQLTTGIDETRIYNSDGSLYQVLEGQMPTVVKGIPLQVKELRVIVDREGFIVNPTSCTPKQISGEAISVHDTTASLASRFQVGECASLDFAPRFNARIMDRGRRSTLRSFNPRVRFTVAPRAGHANIGRAAVTLPPSVILDQGNIRTVCTRAQFAERNCPEASIYGYARAWSPLLNRPVQGPVYLGSSTNQLPDLIADLDGEVRIVLQGRIDTARGGRIRNTFETVPDAPVSRFVLQMRGGNRGILVNSTDLCRDRSRGVANFTGQNGKRSVTRPAIQTAFRGCGQVRRQAARRAATRG